MGVGPALLAARPVKRGRLEHGETVMASVATVGAVVDRDHMGVATDQDQIRDRVGGQETTDASSLVRERAPVIGSLLGRPDPGIRTHEEGESMSVTSGEQFVEEPADLLLAEHRPLLLQPM